MRRFRDPRSKKTDSMYAVPTIIHDSRRDAIHGVRQPTHRTHQLLPAYFVNVQKGFQKCLQCTLFFVAGEFILRRSPTQVSPFMGRCRASDRGERRLERGITLLFLITLLLFPTATHAQDDPTIIVDGDCTLIDAILAANSETAQGNCPAGQPGRDIIQLEVDVEYEAAYGNSRYIGGAQSALPDITTPITIRAGTGNEISGNSTNFRIIHVDQSGKLTLEGITVSGGRVEPVEQAGAVGGGILVNSNAELELIDCIITNNAIQGTPGNESFIFDANGAGIFAAPNSTVFITNSTLIGNVAQGGDNSGDGQGGAIYSMSPLTITNSVISNNIARGGDYEGGGGAGGGIFAEDTLSITNTEVINNSVQAMSGDGRGGGIVGMSEITIFDSLISRNTAQGLVGNSQGGGIMSYDELSITNSTVSENIAQGYIDGFGGGIWYEDALTILNSTVSENIAQGDTGAGLGGGVSARPLAITTFDHVTLINNIATTGGDVIFIHEISPYPLTVTNSILASEGDMMDCARGEDIGPEAFSILNSLGLAGDVTCTPESIVLGTDIDPELRDNGGTHPTHALLDRNDNPAVDTASECTLLVDQRGTQRDDECDIGAYELE